MVIQEAISQKVCPENCLAEDHIYCLAPPCLNCGDAGGSRETIVKLGGLFVPCACGEANV